MNKRRLIYYLTLILLQFLFRAFIVLGVIRNSYNNPLDTAEYRDMIYWFMRTGIVLINVIIIYKIIPTVDKKFKTLLGVASGVGLLLFSYILHEMFIDEELVTLVVIEVLEYILQILSIDFMIRKKLNEDKALRI